jgi:hypothetical protein
VVSQVLLEAADFLVKLNLLKLTKKALELADVCEAAALDKARERKLPIFTPLYMRVKRKRIQAQERLAAGDLEAAREEVRDTHTWPSCPSCECRLVFLSCRPCWPPRWMPPRGGRGACSDPSTCSSVGGMTYPGRSDRALWSIIGRWMLPCAGHVADACKSYSRALDCLTRAGAAIPAKLFMRLGAL